LLIDGRGQVEPNRLQSLREQIEPGRSTLHQKEWCREEASRSSETNLWDEHDAHSDAGDDVVPQVLADVICRQPADTGEEDDEEPLHVPAPRVAPPVGTAEAPADAVQGEFFKPAKGGGTASSNHCADVGKDPSSLPTQSTRSGLNWYSGLSRKVHLMEALKRLVASKRCVSEEKVKGKMTI
jgi:hypothetical protein